ncbi:Translocon-associated protein (TRAP), alpha subunit, putative [Angomonas deanei]|uniref:Translocon-associated protein (TRAP), alpha subunit, putative n=1 Tax=Angomonas deanei TaxID=59799 RepID=A0A7G2CFN4_9TRYP|nr:Translocon-associated protein (TRAP), alpha subunit, putative [Angomonas deanei]
MSKMQLRSVLLLFLISLFVLSVTAEEDVEDIDLDDDEVNHAEESAAYYCYAFFPNQTHPTLPTGSKSQSLIGYQNNHKSNTQTVVLVAGYLQPKGTYGTVLQNFSVVRQARTVKPKESVSFQYFFTPDVYFEPGDYNLVIGLYVQDTTTNSTSFVVGYNSTVALREPLGTDPRTILTYFTLLAIIGGVGYLFRDKIVPQKASAPKRTAQSDRMVSQKGDGEKSDAIDTDYISKDHLQYKQQLIDKTASSSRGRKAAPKIN